jgi:hypothetical protein
VKVKEQCQVKTSSRFAALEKLDDDDDDDDDDNDDDDDDDDVDINRIWESIRENVEASATRNLGNYELNQHKTFFNE